MTLASTVALGDPTDTLMLAIANERGAARSDAQLGVLGKPVHVIAGTAGIAFLQGRSGAAYDWDDVRSVAVRRGWLVVRTEAIRQIVRHTKQGIEVRRVAERDTRSFRLVVDDVVEPALSVPFARVLEDMRVRAFSVHSTSWHEYQNAIERIQGEFSDQDDHVLPIAAAGLWIALGLMATFLVAAMLNAAAARAVPAGAFSLTTRIGPLDPRAIVAAFAFSAILTSFVLRLALGRHAAVWTRGVARGWHRTGARFWHPLIRQLGRVLLDTPSAAAIVLLALLTFWPNIAATVLIDAQGIRNEVLLPFISLEEGWPNVVEISRIAPSDPRDRPGVHIRFSDGRDISTYGLDLGGGTEGQLFQLATAWRQSAR
jgi:hypothetical protein